MTIDYLSTVNYFDVEKNAKSDYVAGGLFKISPQIAALILEKVKVSVNRDISQYKVNEYRRQMRANVWQIAQAIYFDINGELVDGQHRMRAVSKQTQDILFIVVVGLPVDCKAVLDQGKVRTAYDIAKVSGVVGITNLHLQTAACMFLSRRVAVKITNIQRTETYKQYSEGINFVINLVNRKSHLKGARFLSAIAKAYYYESLKRLQEFIEVSNNLIVTKKADIASGALTKAFLLTPKEQRRGSEISWFLKCEKSIYDFCRYKDEDSVEISDLNFYPLVGVDYKDQKNVDRQTEIREEVKHQLEEKLITEIYS